MGEVKIKSGNLYPIAIGEDMWNNLNDATHSNNNGELIVVMGTVENSGIYSPSGSIIRTVHKDLSTYSWSVEIKADSPANLVIGFEGDGVKYFNITSEYQKLTFNNQSFIADRAFVMYNRTGVTRTVYLRNFMLNEGSTALPYQPYFLTLPAHQYVNGQWVDIPTHHYTNGRWQGELTSQSPLKFRADGEMLDWRIEGATNPEPETIVYGFHVDPSIQDPSNAVTYLEDAVGMTPASMGSTSFNSGSWADAFFIPNPCMVRYDGTVDYYLDPADYSKRADGTASDIADPNYAGNAMMEWGLIWYKFDTENLEEGEVNFYVSNKQVDDSYHCWCNYDADGNIIPHFYTAIYNGTGTDKLRSISGVQLTPTNGSGNATGQQEISRAMANNTTTKTEWYIDVLADRELINMLLVLIGKSLNCQAVFGRGLDTGGQAAKEAYVTGTLDDKGLFWGVTGNGNNAVKVFGMENYWGCVWHRVAGMVSVHDATTNSNTVKIKLTHSTVDGTTVNGFNSTGNGYIDTGVEVATDVGVYIRKMKYFDKGYTPLLTTGGSSTTYYSDYTYVNYVGTYYLLAGGNSGNGLNAGPFYFNLHNGFSRSYWDIAACLSLKPRAKVPYNPHNGVGDWDETAQKYKIPVTVRGKNLFNSETVTPVYLDVRGIEHPSEKSLTSDYISVKANTRYTLGETGDIDSINDAAYCFYNSSKELLSSGTYTQSARGNIVKLLTPNDCAYFRFTYNHLRELVEFVEGSYKTLPPYSTTTNLYTDHQLMNGDSIDYATTETTIPIATGNNTLTVDTAVQPSKVFVKFEG